ncbi:proline-serine-threonine phosphatase-interacting protein 1-like isoform X2 [Mya arenaria]|uniref:proline-serine-threonine phosphatase-interacting protein 1-like isoform X2 n=1 Tax=Mya arenaria TaxID=6604 RepID=UPI0022E52EFB|nr:proline-serine-threonine phosphatase-interacting protein 1-like isoform X2 [Mya arenaria]
MTRGLTFAEAFWDSDICGTLGWDRLCKRMKDGRKVCADITHYFKERAKAESDYSKALGNLARKTDCKDETGGLGESWRALKEQTAKIANVHEEAAIMFNQLEADLAKFNDEQKKNKQTIEENVKRYISSKKNEYQKTMSLKKSYEEKCKDFNSAEETFETVKTAVTTKKNELEKSKNKMAKCKDNRDNADLAYKSAIESLESIRAKWESEMEAACYQFEALEATRIDSVRDLLWRCTNVDSMACVKHDECSEDVRMVLEKCDISADIQDFIDTNKSGSKRPDPVLYENYYNTKALPSRPAFQPPPAQGPPRFSAPERPTVPSNGRRPIVIDEGEYATVEEARPAKF